MKRYVYLIRHGKPLFKEGKKICIGSQTDLFLSKEGKEQVRVWKDCFSNIDTIYCSNLARSYQSALEMVSVQQKYQPIVSLQELDMGDFEGKTFQQIQELYPTLYQQRGKDWSIVPSNGETLEDGVNRLIKTIQFLLLNKSSDLVLVIHDGLIRALVHKLENLDPCKDGMPRVDYGTLSVVEIEEKKWNFVAINKKKDSIPSHQEIEQIFFQCKTPQAVIEHSYEVQRVCLELYELLKDQCSLDEELLLTSALLHDMMRHHGKDHPLLAKEQLYHLGYIQLGSIIQLHHDIKGDALLDEAMILYYADKLVQGTLRVSLQQRFEASLRKCCTQEAIEKHQERYLQALKVEEKIRNAFIREE